MVRILLADDHVVVRRGLLACLQDRPDWEVCGEASNGREAVEMAGRLRPDVAVLDLSMPELNGIEATRLIRQQSPATEVLIFTMHQAEELAAEVVAAGARGYVLKTDPPEELVVAVDALSHHTPFFARKVRGPLLDQASRPRGSRPMHGILTGREREIVQLVAEGLRTREIAQHLGISEKTVESHRCAILRKLHLDTVVDIVRYAIRNRLIEA
jgi:DNA-binding NarL/FixJ family response regulator